MDGLPEHIRAFVALRIPDQVRSELAAIQRKLKPEIDDVSWTRPEAMHLTLHFFGNVASAELPRMESALREVGVGFEAFELGVTGVGSFGNRVIWAGLSGDTATLKELAGAVHGAVASHGSNEEDREFKGHVTLGRLRRPRGGVASKIREFSQREFGTWRVDDLEMIRSELSPHGARYTTLFAVELGTNG